MSKASRRVNAMMEYDADFRSVVTHAIKKLTARRRYGHVLSESAHYLTRAAEYRRQGQLVTARSYIKGARSILLHGTNWSNIENLPKSKLP